MGRVSFFLKIPADIRAEFDTEIRRRGYGDCHGMVGWLAGKGMVGNKSSIAKYSKRLKAKDEALAETDLPPETARAIFDLAAMALKTFSAFNRALDALSNERQATEPD